MKRYAASIILGLGLLFGVVVSGSALAGAATATANNAPVTFNSGVGTKPGHGSSLTHMKPTTPHTGSSHDPGTTTTPVAPSATPAPAAASVATSPATGLAFTGADEAGTAILGLALIGGGIVLVGVTRRRSSLAA